MIPNMSDTITEFEVPFVYLQNIVLDDGGFEDTADPVETSITGVMQIPQDQTISNNGLSFSQNYRQVHIRTIHNIKPKIADQIKYKNKYFKVVRFRDFAEYGYYEFIVEELLNGGY